MLPNSPNTFPSLEQKAILESKNRLTIVKAVPGSGKTRVFTNYIENKVINMKSSQGGVAALSFTNSASKEISKRLTVNLTSPHFVGTLDSFLYNFVIKPFGHIFDLPLSGVSIIPSPIDEEMKAREVYVGSSARDKISIHRARFARGTLEKPIFCYKNNYGSYVIIDETYSTAILKGKWKSWKDKGKLTHSDCQYLSAYFLSDIARGLHIIRLLSLKFPWVLIDEFQDTGHFLSISVFKIFSCPRIKGLIVGDADQSIFEFSGANPENFSLLNGIEGTVLMPISITQRCAKNISKLASFFTVNNTVINTNHDALEGKLILCSHDSENIEFDEKIIGVLENIKEPGSILVIARKNKELRSLKGELYDQTFLGTSRSGKILSKSAEQFKNGNSLEAFKSISNLLGELLFGKEITSSNDLEDLGIDWKSWKREIMNLLVSIESEVPGESWNSWLVRSKMLIELIGKNNLGKEIKLGSKFKINKKVGNKIRSITRIRSQMPKALLTAAFKNIHEAKGGEADTVLFYLPKPSKKKCSINSWFGPRQEIEELRVAFVAITRARLNLIIYMHSQSLKRFKELRSDLTEMFEVID